MKHIINLITKHSLYVLLIFSLNSCKKDWLEIKPDKALAVPKTIGDFQALLDNNNSGFAPYNAKQSMLSEVGAGDFYTTDIKWNSAAPLNKNLYIWLPDIFKETSQGKSWEVQYSCIFYANVVLEGIEKITPKNNAEQLDWNQAKGSALFSRAYRHYVVSQDYCKLYDKNTASSDLGIPLRLGSDFNIVTTRSSVETNYSQILSDLKQASSLLPILTPINTIYKLRPTRAAAYAMLARVYLSMSNYDSAYSYADKTLQLYNTLMDYNLSPPILSTGFYRIPMFNPEVILHFSGEDMDLLVTTSRFAEPSFYQSYDINDLRKDKFWTLNAGVYLFTGNYNNGGNLFTGLATDEMYLIRAECLARAGNKTDALNDLNTLMQKRWKNNGTWVPYTATDATDALKKVLIERRKELCIRGLRWTDLRRLNKDPQFAVTLTRTVNGTTYTLPPNSPLYVLPIPPDIIALTGIQQNPR